MAHSVTSPHWESRMERIVTFKEECAQIMQLPQTPWKSGQSNWNSFVTAVFNLIFPAIIVYFTKEVELKKNNKPQQKTPQNMLM